MHLQNFVFNKFSSDTFAHCRTFTYNSLINIFDGVFVDLLELN